MPLIFHVPLFNVPMTALTRGRGVRTLLIRLITPRAGSVLMPRVRRPTRPITMSTRTRHLMRRGGGQLRRTPRP